MVKPLAMPPQRRSTEKNKKTGCTGGGLFENADAQKQPKPKKDTGTGGGLFGAAAAPQPKEVPGLFRAGTGGGLFGNPPAAPAGGLFGPRVQNITGVNNPPAGGLFGRQNNSPPLGGKNINPPAGGLFGAKDNNPPAGGFGGFGAKGNKPQAGGLFGTGSKNVERPTGGLFGDKKNAPAVDLFGGKNKAAAQKDEPKKDPAKNGKYPPVWLRPVANQEAPSDQGVLGHDIGGGRCLYSSDSGLSGDLLCLA